MSPSEKKTATQITLMTIEQKQKKERETHLPYLVLGDQNDLSLEKMFLFSLDNKCGKKKHTNCTKDNLLSSQRECR